MDPLTFIAALVGHLIWPVTALVLILVVLRRLPKLAKFIKAVRYRDLELTLREDFSEARALVDQITIQRQQLPAADAPDDKLLQLIEIDPSIAVIHIWRRLEREIIGLMQHNGLMRYTTPVKFFEHLAKLGKLSENDLVLFRKLRDIRNASVHAYPGRSLSPAEVLEFNNFVDLLIATFEAIKAEPGYINIPQTSKQQRSAS